MRKTISLREVGFIALGIILYMQNWLILQGNAWGYVNRGHSIYNVLFII